MSIKVYILYSKQANKYYTGISSFETKRIKQHKKEKNHWTKIADDWQEVWNKDFENYKDARLMEIKIKKRGAKRFLSDLS